MLCCIVRLCLPVYLCVFLTVCLSVSLCACLHVYLFVCLCLLLYACLISRSHSSIHHPPLLSTFFFPSPLFNIPFLSSHSPVMLCLGLSQSFFEGAVYTFGTSRSYVRSLLFFLCIFLFYHFLTCVSFVWLAFNLVSRTLIFLIIPNIFFIFYLLKYHFSLFQYLCGCPPSLK